MYFINDRVPTVEAVSSVAAGTNPRDLRIQSVASLNTLKYDAWVAKNREFVSKATNDPNVVLDRWCAE